MLGGDRLLRAHVAADEHADQEDDNRDDHSRHEQGEQLLATEMNLVEPVVHFVVGYVSQWALSVPMAANRHDRSQFTTRFAALSRGEPAARLDIG